MSEESSRLLFETQEQSRKNVREGIRLYKKYRRRAVVGSLVTIIMCVAHLLMYWLYGINTVLVMLAGGGIGLALSSRHAFEEIERIPILGDLVVVNHALKLKSLSIEEQVRADEERRTEYQQFEAPGFTISEAS